MLDHPNNTVSLSPLLYENIEIYRYNRNLLDVRRWCREPDLISESDQEEWFQWQHEDPCTKMYEILNSDDDLVGVCGLTSIDYINRRCEFGIYIFPEHQRMGFARYALEVLLAHGFHNLGLNRIWGECFENNPAIELFVSMGFQHEGTRKDFYFKHGDFIDAELYSVGPGQWLS